MDKQLESVTEANLKAQTNTFVILDAYRPGISNTEAVQYYDDHADTYEQELDLKWYRGPAIAAEYVEKYSPDQKDIKILDVAAGTGFVGQQLRQRGFTNVDALDPSPLMLEEAEKKQIYKNFYCYTLEENPTPYEDDMYDSVVSSGGMGEGHIPCEGLLDMIRVTKPRGVIIIVMREQYLHIVKDYRERLELLMQQLEEQGQWSRLERSVVQSYCFDAYPGLVFAYRVGTVANGIK